MSTLTVVANITANADKVELVKAELLKFVPNTRAEDGCINHGLHQDNENPAHFTLYEDAPRHSSRCPTQGRKTPSGAAIAI